MHNFIVKTCGAQLQGDKACVQFIGFMPTEQRMFQNALHNPPLVDTKNYIWAGNFNIILLYS